MPYLNCPTCRLTVYSGPFDSPRENCPRCESRLGKVSRLFKSAVPQRLAEGGGVVSALRDQAAQRRGA